ncbi:MAG: peptide chain release factor 2 [Pseudomonadota bacterium]
MSAELKQMLRDLEEKLLGLRSIFDVAGKEIRLAELEALMAKEGFWDDHGTTTDILRERAQLTDELTAFKSQTADLSDAAVLLDMGLEEEDEQTIREAGQQLKSLADRIRRFSLDRMLSGEDDDKDAIVSVNAGAGGTDAQDWADMLLRMYLRWSEAKGYKTKLMDLQDGEEAGIKSATFSVSGPYAYGYLKLEQGVHRLVRISPYNASGKRQTSFASVAVYPEVERDFNIEIADKDLRIDVFRASGAGGQHVNKTSSAVRVFHIPTGITVSCQQEKSQHRNKDLAMKVLRARLYQREKDAEKRQIQEDYESKEEIAWGSQIRSYVLQPYQMVKDHRINLEVGNIQSVLDGNLDPFMEGVLLSGA